jgi:hypothetical protein
MRYFVCNKCNRITLTANGYWSSIAEVGEAICFECSGIENLNKETKSLKEYKKSNSVINSFSNIVNFKYAEREFKKNVLIVQKYFKSGYPTYFKDLIITGVKVTTIRSNFKRHKSINMSGAILSIREWSKVPYKSSQIHIMTILNYNVQQLIIKHVKGKTPSVLFNGFTLSKTDIDLIAKLDGISYELFCEYFNLNQISNKTKNVSYAIIHFNNFASYKMKNNVLIYETNYF